MMSRILILSACLLTASLSGCADIQSALGPGTNSLSPAEADADSDGVPDALEAEICRTRAVRDTMSAHNVGSCDELDWTPPAAGYVSERIPTLVLPGDDADGDGFPATVDLHYRTLTIDAFSGHRYTLGEETVESVPLDVDDADPETPIVSTVKMQTSIPMGVGLGDDNDGDALPSHVELSYAYLTVERRSPQVELEARGMQLVPIDEHDDDASQPVVDQVTTSVPLYAYTTGDADQDMLPASLEMEMVSVTVDRVGDNLLTTNKYVESVPVDDDDDRDSHVPLSMVDGDVDFVPDAAEPIICMVQREYDPVDGGCHHDDGSGHDGAGDNYFPPGVLSAGLFGDPRPQGGAMELGSVLDDKESPGPWLPLIALALLYVARRV